MKKERIWELDALRGLCILGMILIHFVFDLVFFDGFELTLPPWFQYLQQYGHLFFILISGICATLGSKSFRRGLIVFGAGLAVSYATLFADYVVGMEGLRIWFGILHLLGLCMLVYPLFRRLPWWALALLGTAFVALGIWFARTPVTVDFLFPLGLRSGNIFTGSDYFPVFPGLGWFLLGAALGKTVYRSKRSLLPNVPSECWIFRYFRFFGRHSLEIYLVHQPILLGIALLITAV